MTRTITAVITRRLWIDFIAPTLGDRRKKVLEHQPIEKEVGARTSHSQGADEAEYSACWCR
jgi:hypothetical protein